jgi:hypothetical protein
LAASAPGTTATATTDAVFSTATLPVTLTPGHVLQAQITINPPSTPGSYAYRIGVAIDGAGPIYPTAATPAIVQASVAHTWNGDACLTSAMQSQIPPATDPPTYYICPQL